MTVPKGSPREGGGSERSEQGGVGDGTKKWPRRVNAGATKSLLFLLFRVKLYFT